MEQGKLFIVIRDLYGFKLSSAAFRSFAAKKLDDIGFNSCVADPDVFLRTATKPYVPQYQ